MGTTLKSRRAVWLVKKKVVIIFFKRISCQYHSFCSYFQVLAKYENTRHSHNHSPIFFLTLSGIYDSWEEEDINMRFMLHSVFEVRLDAWKESFLWSAGLKFHLFMVFITIYLLPKNYLGSISKFSQIGYMGSSV